LNYNEEQTLYMVDKYVEDPRPETVEALALQLGKSSKSIIGKLSREGVYQRAVYTSKTGEAPITKADLVSNIAENLGIEVEDLVGLDKSPKATLKALELATGSKKTKTHQREPFFNRP
jgi:hypothetical protein